MPIAPRLCEFLLPVGVLLGSVMTSTPIQAEAAAPAPVVYVIGGVGGLENLHSCVRWAFGEARIHCELRNYAWTHGKGKILKDLQDHRYLAWKAEKLADEVRRLKVEAPERPIFFIGRSGGAGLALAAAGQLPADTLERIILLSPAVSPDFNLVPALRATRNEIVSFYSDLDWFVLGWGTSQFGTADRVYCPSAGLKGFVKPSQADPETLAHYRRLVEIRWSAGMLLTGNTGGHIGTTMPLFLLREVAPWIRF